MFINYLRAIGQNTNIKLTVILSHGKVLSPLLQVSDGGKAGSASCSAKKDGDERGGEHEMISN